MGEPRRNPSADFYRELAGHGKYPGRYYLRNADPDTSQGRLAIRALREAGLDLDPVDPHADFDELRQKLVEEPGETRADLCRWINGLPESKDTCDKLRGWMDTYLDQSADPVARGQALNELDAYRQKSSEGRQRHFAMSYDDERGYDQDGPDRGRKRREQAFGGYDGRPMRKDAVEALKTGRRDRPRDADAASESGAHAFLDACALERGVTLEEIAAPPKPGRPSKHEQERRLVLAQVVKEARDKGFTQFAIAAATGLLQQRISELERRAA